MKTVTQFDLVQAQLKALENNSIGLALACRTQDSETLVAIQELLSDDAITACLFETYTGDYTNIFVSYDIPSYNPIVWYKVD